MKYHDSLKTGLPLMLALCLLLAAVTCRAQAAASDPGVESTEPETGYTLGSGDVVQITVLNEEDLSGLFSVTSQGQISYPFLGSIDVGKLTAADLARYLTLRLGEHYLVDPVITVSVESFQSKKVFLQGEVAKPGVYYLKERSGVMNLLLEAGGTTKDASEEIVVLRSLGFAEGDETEQYQQLFINLRQLLSGDQTQNVPVRHGDIIYIANASGGQFRTEGRFINIMGEVKKPGNYDYRLGLTVLNAILEAGGFTEYAARNKVKVIKKVGDEKRVIIARLDDLVSKGDLDRDIALEPGDLVVVPQSLF